MIAQKHLNVSPSLVRYDAVEKGSARVQLHNRNLSPVAERHQEISQPQCGWYDGKERFRPEGTKERLMVSIVLSGRGLSPGFPATPWLADFHCRSATPARILQSTTFIALPFPYGSAQPRMKPSVNRN
jgi:hypothetical protein